MKPDLATSVGLVGGAVALALTQMSLASVLAGLAIGVIGHALMPRETIQR